MRKIRVGVIGATGFTGEMLVTLLSCHPKVLLNYLAAKVDEETLFSNFVPQLKGRVDLLCKNLDLNDAAKNTDIIFLALPHKVSFLYAPYFLKKGKIVIDLSADYRLDNPAIYNKYYGVKHKDISNLKNAVYGLPEFFRSKIKKSRLIANPGCYPTVSILALAPLLKEKVLQSRDIIIDAKSGISGAGRHPYLEYHYININGNIWPYKVFNHQHLPEIVQVIKRISGSNVKVRFTPHIIPVERGILVTIYARLKNKYSYESIQNIYRKYYLKAPFVRLRDDTGVQLKYVVGTNFCDLGFWIDKDEIVISGAIDNLIKGASGQAVQNMNIILGLDETVGLL